MVPGTHEAPGPFKKTLNSDDVKAVALSDTITRGRPWVANVWRSRSTVTAAEVDVVTCTSSHLE